jgi:putative acetyltransferase
MNIIVRNLRPEETRTFLEVHHAAVRGIAAADYQSDVIEAWAPLPITDKAVERVLSNPDREIRLAAVWEGEIVGIGAVIPRICESRACYVAPKAARNGVGTALINAIERIAREHRTDCLELDSSLTAEPFYLRLGYRNLKRSTHTLRSGCVMACVKMRKNL